MKDETSSDLFRELLDPVRHPVLTPEEVGAILKVSRATVYAYVSQGRIPGVIRLSPKRFRIATATFAREMLGIETTPDVSGTPEAPTDLEAHRESA